MISRIYTLLILIALIPLSSFAEIPVQIRSDFAPLAGVIIMPVGDQYLVDLDASSNIKEGDILSLTVPGEKVIHPVTKEVLGSLDTVKGYLQVTQIKSGYSYAQLITAITPPEKGAQVKRFEQVPASFTSSVTHPRLDAELKAALPHLKWIDSNSNSEIPQLVFQLNDSTLKVDNIDGVTIRNYPFTAGQLSAPLAPQAVPGIYSIADTADQNTFSLNSAVSGVLETVGLGGKDKRLENPGITYNASQNNSLWMSQNLNGNPVGLAVGDFDGDGILETAVAMKNHIQILKISEGKLSLAGQIDFSGGLTLLSLDAIDLNKDGHPELYASAHNDTNVRSQVVEYLNGQYQVSIAPIKWLFRVVDIPGQGNTLIGQTISKGEDPFNTPAFKVSRHENTLSKAEPITIPHGSFFSVLPFTSEDNDLMYAYNSQSDYLNISSGQLNRLWKSGDHFGGSEDFFYNQKEKQEEVILPIYTQKRIIKLSTGEILTAQNEGSRALERFRNFDSSRVVAFKWDGFALSESWRTTDQDGYLVDFAIADADNDGNEELIVAVLKERKNLFQKGKSNIFIYELNQ